jgi:hypothetical protein
MTDTAFNPQTAFDTREAWLIRAIDVFRPRFAEIGFPLPDQMHVSVGFGGTAKKENKTTLGTAWPRSRSEDNLNHVFISPEDSDTTRILATLLHELVHVALDNEDGHTKRFRKIALALGMEGKMTETIPGPALEAELVVIAAELGEFPHARLDASRGRGGRSSGPAPQANRHHKAVCDDDGYTVRLSRKWAEAGAPRCGICGERMTLTGGEDGEG